MFLCFVYQSESTFAAIISHFQEMRHWERKKERNGGGGTDGYKAEKKSPPGKSADNEATRKKWGAGFGKLLFFFCY